MVAVENSGLLDDNQHGFRRGRSCNTAHTVLSNNVHNMLEAPNMKVFMVFVDLKKAFDSVRHLPLLEMLRDYYSIDHNLIFVIFNYLTDRNFYIKLGSFISNAYDL
jgi:retron-type reverse transcriptase